MNRNEYIENCWTSSMTLNNSRGLETVQSSSTLLPSKDPCKPCSWKCTRQGKYRKPSTKTSGPRNTHDPECTVLPKDGTPLRPILAMISSPQHKTAKWLAQILQPVSKKYSKYVAKDSFEFSDFIRKVDAPDSLHMCSFDIKSLSTNVSLDETIKI